MGEIRALTLEIPHPRPNGQCSQECPLAKVVPLGYMGCGMAVLYTKAAGTREPGYYPDKECPWAEEYHSSENARLKELLGQGEIILSARWKEGHPDTIVSDKWKTEYDRWRVAVDAALEEE